MAFTTNGLGAHAADSTWLVNTVAGNGVAGFSGDGGQAVNAELNDPQGVAVDSIGDVYFADLLNGRVRKVSPTGSVTTIAGSGAYGYGGDGGAAVNAKFRDPDGLALDGAGNLWS